MFFVFAIDQLKNHRNLKILVSTPHTPAVDIQESKRDLKPGLVFLNITIYVILNILLMNTKLNIAASNSILVLVNYGLEANGVGSVSKYVGQVRSRVGPIWI